MPAYSLLQLLNNQNDDYPGCDSPPWNGKDEAIFMAYVNTLAERLAQIFGNNFKTLHEIEGNAGHYVFSPLSKEYPASNMFYLKFTE